ncbi:ABC transporter substrate-binding protein [Cellulomonas citrea]|uniref:ABC transporter substrate-binding protein n=1 Tax=Cellulomonas citrea TaxID=1909423 RepID=UPI001359314E|nr:sugar ABC transporter substrate-binding protein [Cellulomonas citrea]
MSTPVRHRARAVAALAVGALVSVSLAACSSSSSSSGSSSDASAGAASLDAALAAGGEITYWTWTPSAKDQVAAFEKAYPKVKVNLVDTGGAGDNNTKLQNAIKAGSGAPDVVQIEYQSLPQFVLPGNLLDLTPYGIGDLQSKYSASTWGAVAQNKGIWALPQDSGPMVMFYNKTVFDKYGLTVPTTWDEYIAQAKKLHAADPTKFFANDPGDAGYTTSMIWQAGGHPFVADGQNVKINLQDSGSTKWADMWNQLNEAGLLGAIPGWSDQWFQGLGDGTIATLVTGGWMPGVLEASVPSGSGQWRVAPMPTYDANNLVTAENGGSSEAVVKQSANPALAAAFLRWLNSDPESIKIFLASGGFPSTTADLESSDFLNKESAYFGGQKINQVIVDSSKHVASGWQYLPWQSYANSIFSDTVGKSFLNHTDINEGLKAWQEQNVSYGQEQGFTVSTN